MSLQLPVLRWVAHWRRTRLLGVAAVLVGLAWGLLGVRPSAPVVLAFAAVFGLGEVFQSPAMQPLLNAVSTDALRGRYNALSGMMFSLAFVLSPALSGLLIGNGLGRLWIAGLCAGALGAPLLLLDLRRRLTDEQDGLVPVAVTSAA